MSCGCFVLCCSSTRFRCVLTSVYVDVGMQARSRDVLREGCVILGWGGVGKGCGVREDDLYIYYFDEYVLL